MHWKIQVFSQKIKVLLTTANGKEVISDNT